VAAEWTWDFLAAAQIDPSEQQYHGDLRTTKAQDTPARIGRDPGNRKLLR